MLSTAIRLLRPGVTFGPGGLVGLRNDGQGAYIERWQDPRTQPTASELAAVASQAAALEMREAMPAVTRDQMFKALHRAGKLTLLKTAMTASANTELKITFDEAPAFKRVSDLSTAMTTALSLTEAQVDALFTTAWAI